MSSVHLKSPSDHAILGGVFPAELQIRGKASSGEKITLCHVIEKGATGKIFKEMGFGGEEFNNLSVEGWKGEGDIMVTNLELKGLNENSNYIHYIGADTEKTSCGLREYYVSVDTLTMDDVQLLAFGSGKREPFRMFKKAVPGRKLFQNKEKPPNYKPPPPPPKKKPEEKKPAKKPEAKKPEEKKKEPEKKKPPKKDDKKKKKDDDDDDIGDLDLDDDDDDKPKKKKKKAAPPKKSSG